ncbi:4-oxalocrotonate tautomerase [Pelomonas saccharophila]|uniref:Tautomerase n=1 Tax=Roseateles saccharophilus TaxID=304 RepID=A0ABU1YL36_ROSSA|nr:4-oxalocrotonate tautomerase family protein [Roseateles saccharophilus]MDR7269443.1 4-oxalocrotonate tautomerase [Roseateles saccharophilus]
MPYVRIEVTREGVTLAQKQQLIAEATEMMVRVLNKDPAATFVVIDEIDTDNWGVAGRTVTELRREQAAQIKR